VVACHGTLMENDEWLTEAQALALLPFARTFFQKERAMGKIPFYKFGKSIRFKRSDIERYLATQRKGPRTRAHA
jgi:excisionase family DNA binding protein